MLNKELESTLNSAFKVARDKRHEFMTVEHLLLAMLENAEASDVLTACGVELKKLGESYGITSFKSSIQFFKPKSDNKENRLFTKNSFKHFSLG